MNLFAPHLCDFYKVGHRPMFPEGTTKIYSNMTPRSERLAATLKDFDGKVVFVGLQGVIQWLLIDVWNKSFFNRPKEEVLAKYKRRMDTSLGQDVIPIDHIEALHDLGYLPLLIKALPEGSRVNIKVPFFTITNTHPDFAWLVNYMETMLSAEVWKTCTTATTAYEYRRLLNKYAKETGSPLDFVLWQGHDFSMRGMSGVHDASQSSIGHLLSFYGTDTIPAIDYLEEYYFGKNTFIGGSVAASEHSVMCMGGKTSEVETMRYLMKKFPRGVLSIVSDSWDFWKVITKYAKELKAEILARQPDANGLAKIVFRPDSGDPVKILCGYISKKACQDDLMDEDFYFETKGVEVLEVEGKYYKFKAVYEYAYYWDEDSTFQRIDLLEEVPENEVKGAIELLWEIFGGTTTSEGFKLLDSHVGLIYGDSITLKRAEDILSQLKAKGFASANVVFGIGSYTYQYVTRDSFGQAVKATYGEVNGEARELFKDPITDSGTKKSAKGLLRVELEDGDYKLYDQQSDEQERRGELRIVFADGVCFTPNTVETMRARLHGGKFNG